jgi:hypothetical protein
MRYVVRNKIFAAPLRETRDGLYSVGIFYSIIFVKGRGDDQICKISYNTSYFIDTSI